MKILMVASEAAPFAKTGGLADVLGALPPALARLGEDVAVVLPKYRATVAPDATRIATGMRLWVGPHIYTVDIEQLTHQGVRYFFVDCPVLYDRPSLYGEPDNDIRFALLSQAALGVVRDVFRAQVIHCHDWQTGLVPAYLRAGFSGDPTFIGVRTVFTIHNAGYQGNFPGAVRTDLGLDLSLFHPGGLEFFGDVSFFKAAVVWSDALTTVSPTYAREIQTPEYGFRMDGVLRDHASKLTGIQNGVDYNEWNPKHDPYLDAHYSAQDLSGKWVDKRALLKEMGLPENERPLIGIVSRFATQKGFDLVEGIAEWLGDQDVSLVALGSGEVRFEKMFQVLAATWPDKFAVRVGYDDGLAHRIEAGSDMFLMPSHYEPCGLNQIYSLHYGTVPIVRATGGLEDTVDEETGFKFRDYTPEALQAAVQEALDAFADKRAWITRMRRGMAKDFSWDASAAEYQRLYRSVTVAAR